MIIPVKVQAAPMNAVTAPTFASVTVGDNATRAVTRKIVNDCYRTVARPHHIDWCGNTADRFIRMRWSSWRAHEALARGIGRFNDCRPTCAEGTMHNYPVRVRLHRDVRVNGHPRFSRLTWRFTDGPDGKQWTIPLLLKPL